MHDETIKALGQVLRANNAEIDQKIERARLEAKAAAQAMIGMDFTGSLVKSWREQRVYKAGDVVSHRGGTFQAMQDTDTVPEKSDGSWACVMNGIHKDFDEMINERTIRRTVEMSNGIILTSDKTLPIPIHRGTWESGVPYENADEVAKNGATWRSMTDNNLDEPGQSSRWQLAAQQGKTGKPGIQGDRGEKGDVGPAGQDANPLTAAKLMLAAVNKELEDRFNG